MPSPPHPTSVVEPHAECLPRSAPTTEPFCDSPPSSVPLHAIYRTEPDEFGLYREYSFKPCHDPTELETPDLLVDSPTIAVAVEAEEFTNRNPLRVLGEKIAATAQTAIDWFSPFKNPSVFRLLNWTYSGSTQKSSDEINRLVHNVILADDFDIRHFDNFSYNRELQRLDEHDELSGIFSAGDGWQESSVKIRVPKEKVKHRSEDEAPEFEVKGLWYRPLRNVIKSAYEDITQRHFHTRAFKLFCTRSAASNPMDEAEPDERIWTDIYNSDAMLEEQAKVDALSRNPADSSDVEYAVAPLMLWSDSTRLANFGTQSLWPIYLFFGSLSKYMRGRPSTFAAHHLAYMPSVRNSFLRLTLLSDVLIMIQLPDAIQDFYQRFFGVSATADVLRFCRSQVLQAVWLLLLDPDFMHAYEHGMLVQCGDGVLRRLFPRFLTYSADYPERFAIQK